mgnify:CR=1 FL=1
MPKANTVRAIGAEDSVGTSFVNHVDQYKTTTYQNGFDAKD